ncbi:glycosyl transferase [Segetibacter sp. 3557_3]|uniref:glycosyl transferase n=1 Tax=Segetibacter sp. 3557_3 TaxID=2547429 RepID=UPI0010586BBA|nr:glycosyl transferase [Segetibacter sp. 3557_3]TDH20842.1 glycosyl transferase [Segetibacter sp. 3557_3]
MIAFTICSNNYLAHAKTLGDSFLQHHPEAKFIIGLVDKFDDDFDYKFFKNIEFVLVEELSMSEFPELLSKYNITELNTSVKPAYFHYLFKKYNADKVIYLDPDILVTSRFEEVINTLAEKNIVLTPHICSPIDDDYAPSDFHTLGGGIFNLGFIALSNYSSVNGFLNWWHDRVVKYGYCDQSKNMFYDQLWINYVPCFYPNHHILSHVGYNMANWNLHERNLTVTSNTFTVNSTQPLRFFHFSSYKYERPDVICAYLTRYNFNSRPDLVPLFDQYRKLLQENGIEQIKKLKVFYFPQLDNVQITVEQKKPILSKLASRVNRSANILRRGYE